MEKIYYRVADRPLEQIEAFKDRYNFVSENDIKEVFENLGYEVLGIEKAKSWGTAHLIYYVKTKKNGEEKELVFRSNSGALGGFEKPEVIMFGEKLITDLVSDVGVETNRILQVDISRKVYPFDYQIEEKLTGVDPEIYIDERGNFLDGKGAYDKISFALGQAIARYSNLKFTNFGLPDESEILKGNIIGKNRTFYEYITTNLEEHLIFLREHGVISKKEFDKVLRIFTLNESVINDCDSCLVHHDLADHNLTYDTINKGLGAIFDWEAMVLGDPMLDLGSCPTWNTHFPRKDLLIKGYSSIKLLPLNYELKMNLYELRTRIWKMKFLVQLNNPKEPVNPQINAFEELLKRF